MKWIGYYIIRPVEMFLNLLGIKISWSLNFLVFCETRRIIKELKDREKYRLMLENKASKLKEKAKDLL